MPDQAIEVRLATHAKVYLCYMTLYGSPSLRL